MAKLLFDPMGFSLDGLERLVLDFCGEQHENDHLNCPRYTCPQLNISECAISERNNQFVILVQNSLAREHDTVVRLPIKGSRKVIVTDSDGHSVDSTLVDIPKKVLKIPGRKGHATSEVVFFATGLPPMGLDKNCDHTCKPTITNSRVQVLLHKADPIH